MKFDSLSSIVVGSAGDDDEISTMSFAARVMREEFKTGGGEEDDLAGTSSSLSVK